MSHVFFGASNERLCADFYVDPTISRILQALIRKTISILRLTQKNMLIEKRVRHFLLHEHVQIF